MGYQWGHHPCPLSMWERSLSLTKETLPLASVFWFFSQPIHVRHSKWIHWAPLMPFASVQPLPWTATLIFGSGHLLSCEIMVDTQRDWDSVHFSQYLLSTVLSAEYCWIKNARKGIFPRDIKMIYVHRKTCTSQVWRCVPVTLALRRLRVQGQTKAK